MTNIVNHSVGSWLAGLILCICLVACNTEKEKSEPTMVQLLEKVSREKFYVPENIYASRARVAYFDSLAQTASIHEKNKYILHKALNLLYGGHTSQSIELLESLLDIRKKARFVEGLEAYEEDQLEASLALAYLRLGEQENCLLNHTASSCIVPIRAEGFHQKTYGSEKAAKLYEQLLSNHAHDYSSRWLLNVAYMTLGKYPHDVPKNWLIPEKAFQSDYPLPHFPDIAPALELDDNRLAGGAITEDFTNDGFIDLLVTSWAADHPMKFFVNKGDGTFEEKTKEAGLAGITGGLNMLQADYNNDGYVDVLVLRGAWLEKLGAHPNSLLRNNGDGTFTDITIESGMLSFHPTQTAVWTDINLDGWIDLFIGNESSAKDNVHPCELYLNQQNGTFREVAREAGIAVSSHDTAIYYVKGVTAGDVDNDGWPDIYVSSLDNRKRNLLFRNNGPDEKGIPLFTDISLKAGLGETISSFPTWFWDYNNDGFLDIFVAGFQRSNPWESITKDVAAEYLSLSHQAETARLYQNNGHGTFTNVSEKVGLNKITYAMGANFGDMDNDGFQDMYLATGEVNFASIIPNRAFRNKEGKVFQDVTTTGGFGHLQKGHAVCFADLDNDGDQDIYVVMGGAYEGDGFRNALFHNPGNTHAWITLRLEGTSANRSAIGARIKIKVKDQEGKTSHIYSVVSSGGSFGASSLQQEVGLGSAVSIEEIEISWPDRRQTVSHYTSVEKNSTYRLVQGVANFTKIPQARLSFHPSHRSHQ